MTKIITTLILLLTLLLGGGYFLSFTKSGNDILKPFINSYLKQELRDIDVKVNDFRLTPDHIVLFATINGMIKANIDSDFDLSNNSFNATYRLKANKIETKDIKIDEKIYIEGKAVGDIDKSIISGIGKIANSDVEYRLDLIANKPKNIIAKIDKADLAKLLTLAGKKPYANGVVTLIANIPSLDEQKLKGHAKLTLSGCKINSTLIKKDFKINIPQNTTFKLNSSAMLNKNSVNVDAKLLSSLGDISIKNLTYNLNNRDLKAPYIVDITKLKKLNSLANMQLRGSFRANGKIYLKRDTLSLTSHSKSFGGELSIAYSKDKALAIFKQISTKTLFYKLGLEKYTEATLTGKADITSIKNLNGKFHIVANGINSKYNLKKLYNFDINRAIKYHITSSGTLKEHKVFANTDIKSNLVNMKLKNAIYNLQTSSFNSPYEIYVDNLAKLNYITKQKLVGDLKIVGKISQAKDLMITGHINKFNGIEEFKLKNNLLSANIKSAKLTDIQKTISYPLMLEASTDATLSYDLKSSNGNLSVIMKKAKMLPNELTKIIKGLGGVDLSAEHYNDTKLDAKLSKNLIRFNFHAISKAITLSIKNGLIYQPAGKLKAHLVTTMKDKNLKLNIKGTTSKPKISLDTSSIQNRIKDKIKKELESKKEKLEDKLKEKLKDSLFKNLF